MIAGVARQLQTVTARVLVAARVRLDVGDRTAACETPGPLLIVANHASPLDSAVLLAALPSRHRRRSVAATRTDNLGALIRSGRDVLVFPEGGCSTDGVTAGFSTAAADVAIEHGVAVLPVGILGTFAALPGDGTAPVGLPFAHTRPRVGVRFGAVLHAEPDESPTAFTGRIAEAVRSAIAEDRTTWWQSLRHGSDATELPPAGSWRRIWERSQSPRAGGQRSRPRIWRG